MPQEVRCRCRMQETTSNVARIDGRPRSRLEHPRPTDSQRTNASDEIGVHHRVQWKQLLLFQHLHLALVNHPPDVEHVVFVEVIRLQPDMPTSVKVARVLGEPDEPVRIEVESLRDEISRLRALLRRHDIDPDEGRGLGGGGGPGAGGGPGGDIGP